MIEENRGEAQKFFIDAKLFDAGAGSVSARVGRQELLLGELRLVSPLDWANTRRTFDGYRLTYASQEFDADLFYTNPVNRVAATGGTNEWDSSNNKQHEFLWSLFVARGDGSFDHNFPLAHKYNGFMDLFGRRNLNDVNMQFLSPMGDKVNLLRR